MYGGSVGRRVRRRRSLIAWGVVGVVVAISFGITRAAGEAELSRAYLDMAFDVIITEEKVAEDFSAMILGIEDYNRATMTELLQDLEADTAAMVDLLDEAEPPESLQQAHLFLRIATTTWRSALSDARNGLVALADDPLDDDGLTQLERGLVDLRVGDSAYAGFLSEMTDVDTELQGGRPPVVAFVLSSQEELFVSQDLARRLFLAPELGPVQNIAIADLRLDPAPVGEQEGLPVIAFLGTQRAEVTVSNRGNISAAAISIQLSLISNEGTLWEARQAIDLLEGGSLTSIVFSEIPIEPGITYQIVATSLFADDDDEDDSFSLTFLVNPEG
jgi:hypothetical protein